MKVKMNINIITAKTFIIIYVKGKDMGEHFQVWNGLIHEIFQIWSM